MIHITLLAISITNLLYSATVERIKHPFVVTRTDRSKGLKDYYIWLIL